MRVFWAIFKVDEDSPSIDIAQKVLYESIWNAAKQLRVNGLRSYDSPFELAKALIKVYGQDGKEKVRDFFINGMLKEPSCRLMKKSDLNNLWKDLEPILDT